MTDALPKVTISDHPEWVELYRMAWETAMGNIVENPNPKWGTQVACMPGIPICWVWDSCFIALYSRYGNGTLPALRNLDSLYAHQRDDGFIAMAYQMTDGEPAYGERINPPLFAWAELDYARVSGDQSRLRRVLPHLVRLFDWYKANRRRPDGLYWFEDSGSSGMDNSPRSGYFSEHLNGSDICHLDLVAQQAFAAETIVEIATQCGDVETANRFRQERQELAPVMEQHWCERAKFYHDLFYHTLQGRRHNFLNHRTIAAFWPMFAGLCSTEQAAALANALFDPDDFWTPHPVATLSRRDPNYHEEGCYWLGGVWAPTNYMVVRALGRYGYHAEARELAVRHLDAMSRVARQPEYGGIWECYSPDFDRPATRSADGQLCRPNFVGWSGLGPISMLIEQILGLEFDALKRRVVWRISLPGEHGIEQLRFGAGTVSLKADPEKGSVQVESDQALTIHIHFRGEEKVESITPGIHQIMLPT